MKKINIFIVLGIVLVSTLIVIAFFIIGLTYGLKLNEIREFEYLVSLLSVMGVWVGAIATTGAVIVSLWLALKQLSKDREVLEFTVNPIVMPPNVHETFIGVTIVSKGNKPSSVQSVSWGDVKPNKYLF